MRYLPIVVAALGGATAANAQDAQPLELGLETPPPPLGGGDQELAKKLSNPVSSLISVPLQQNIDFGGGGTGDGVKMTLNIQPVVPISIAPKWNMIVRTIFPIIDQADISAPGENQFGLGDTVQSFFFSPKETGSNGIIWGAGPVVFYPTATDRLLGGDKWGLGPTAVLLKQSGKATFGMLANHIWSVAGNSARDDISTTFVQPFYSYTTSRATTFLVNTETTYDWKGDNWVVPINFSVAQLTKIGNQPIQFGVAVRYYIEKPAGGPDWGVRLVLALLFPK